MNTLQDKAMLVRLSISQWTARKFDKNVTAKVAADYNANENVGRYNKVLVAESAIKTIQRTANDARSYHYEQTLPWGDDDSRLLPAANYLPYTRRMNELRARFEGAAEDFIAAYPSLVEDARTRLNGMFSIADYPVTSEIRRRYSFNVTVNPLPAAEDFRVTLQAAEVEQIKIDIELRTGEAQQRAMIDLWNRLHEAVEHIAAKLSDSDAVFRDSLIENVVDLCELLPRLNVLQDDKLETMRQDVEKKLCSYAPQVLREDEVIRCEAASTAKDILSAMSGYMGGAQ